MGLPYLRGEGTSLVCPNEMLAWLLAPLAGHKKPKQLRDSSKCRRGGFPCNGKGFT